MYSRVSQSFKCRGPSTSTYIFRDPLYWIKIWRGPPPPLARGYSSSSIAPRLLAGFLTTLGSKTAQNRQITRIKPLEFAISDYRWGKLFVECWIPRPAGHLISFCGALGVCGPLVWKPWCIGSSFFLRSFLPLVNHCVSSANIVSLYRLHRKRYK